MLTETSRSIGPYELLELLGQGGMGQVWRARHRLSGQTVALKTLEAASEGLLRSLRREIHALARLRHPGVVRILEEGLEGGVPWYTMELLVGQTLRQWQAAAAVQPKPPLTEVASAEPWWTVSLEALERRDAAEVQEAVAEEPGACSGPGLVAPAALREVLSLMRRLCAPLAYLHGEGLVHCDLKPENVLVRPAGGPGAPPGSIGMPVLVDFGLAGQFATLSREALELETAASGTVAYMAPEQLRSELLDARADLYALGCILYELLTGRPPFLGKTSLEVLEQHLRVAPPPPSSLVQALPPELDAVVLRLLEKEPRRRFGHADDVAAALAKLGAEDGLAAEGSRPRAYLYRPGFCGRELPLRQLEERLLHLQEQDAGAVVLLGGESGVGKTRLLMEVGKEAVRRRLQVLGGECQGGAARPLEALRKPLLAIADRCRARGEQETERLLGRRGPVLALYEPTLRSLPGQVEAQDIAPLPADAAQQRLYSYLTETLAAFAKEAPVVVLLDDLQWADDLTLGFLGALLRTQTLETLQAVPLLVLGTYRSEEVRAADQKPLQDLLQASGVGHLALEHLEEAAVGSMVGDMLALEPPPRLLVRFLSRQSEGNPFFVAEYLRAAVDEQLLWRDVQGRWQIAVPAADQEASEEDYAALPLPGSVRELVGRRLQDLPEEARRLLDAAAVLGREADVALAAEMTRMSEAQLDDALGELLRRQVLEASGPELMRFVHDQIREVAYERLPGAGRPLLHRAAAEAMEAVLVPGQREQHSELGRHWEAAGEPGKAVACYLPAARAAAARYAHEEAERLYRAYLRLIEEPSLESISARNELGEKILGLRGRNDEALGQHERALSEARRIGARALAGESLLGLGRLLWRTARLEEAREAYEQALAISRQLGDLRFEANVLSNLGAMHMGQGRTAEARELYEQALAISRQVGDLGFEGIVLGNLGILHMEQGRMAEAQELYEQALAISRQVGDLRSEGNLLSNLGILHMDHGRKAEGRQLCEQALAISRQRGDLRFEANVLSNLGFLHMEQGRMAEGRQLFEQALAIHRQFGNRRNEGFVLGSLGRLYMEQGRIAEATQLCEQALAIHRQLGDRRLEANVLGSLGLLHLEHGRTAEARQRYERALAITRQLGDRRFEGIVLGGLANLELFGAADRPRARMLAEEGERLLAAVGEQLELALVLCCQGHIALAGGRDGREPLERAEALASAAGAGNDSPLGKAISRLRRAVAAFEAGEHHRLFRGKLIEDLPEALLRRFIESGELAEPEELGGK